MKLSLTRSEISDLLRAMLEAHPDVYLGDGMPVDVIAAMDLINKDTASAISRLMEQKLYVRFKDATISSMKSAVNAITSSGRPVPPALMLLFREGEEGPSIAERSARHVEDSPPFNPPSVGLASDNKAVSTPDEDLWYGREIAKQKDRMRWALRDLQKDSDRPPPSVANEETAGPLGNHPSPH